MTYYLPQTTADVSRQVRIFRDRYVDGQGILVAVGMDGVRRQSAFGEQFKDPRQRAGIDVGGDKKVRSVGRVRGRERFGAKAYGVRNQYCVYS
tara:strand:+ start:443 stop:721 length:279 start_codon:yes stop_codon:yes gene_type:complete